MSLIEYTENKNKGNLQPEELQLFSEKEVEKVVKFHKSMGEAYNITPLVRLKELADYVGIKELWVKDESKRGTLKAFKLLGGAYSVARCICRKLGVNIEDIDFQYLKSRQVKDKVGEITFAAASDGNHGKSVAWAANEFNQKSIVYMPKGTAEDRIKAIEDLGGKVVVSEHNYDWCVSEVNRLSIEKGWEVVLDTASEGDRTVATWVMQGYATMAYEVIEQLGEKNPTHLFLQAGVGSMAAAVGATFVNYYKEKCPEIYILEPHQYNCYYYSGKNNDGKAVEIAGDEDSIMAGLSCGVPNPVSWKILKNIVSGFFSCDDILAANGMRILGNPLSGDIPVTSGESGAIGTGFLDTVTKQYPEIIDKIGLNAESEVILFSTEGDTDTKNYRDVVWYGKYGLQ
jgi:diaminopropionate ammonia-lyase